MESSEWMTAGQAARELGVSKTRMARLIARNEVRWKPGTFDARVKLVNREDVERIKREPGGKIRQNPKEAQAAA